MTNALPSTEEAKEHWAIKADAWNDWADPMQAMAAKFNAPLLDAAKLSEGMKVLDLASGAGEPALSAAKKVGPTGLCCATDFVPKMLSGIQKREGAGRLLLSAADMQALPFCDGVFDRVICRFGVMFAPDIRLVISELQRVLRPDGRIALMVWGSRQDQTLFKCLNDAIVKSLGITPDAHHYSIFRFGEAGSLSKSFDNTHFINISENLHSFEANASTEKPFWRAQLDMSFGHLLNNIDKSRRAELDEAIKSELSNHIKNGKYQLKSHIRILTADIAR